MKKNRFIWLIIIVFITKTTALYASAEKPDKAIYTMAQPDANAKITKGSKVIPDKAKIGSVSAKIGSGSILSINLDKNDSDSDNEADASVRPFVDMRSSKRRYSDGGSSEKIASDRKYSSLLKKRSVTPTKKAPYNPNINTDIVVKGSLISHKKQIRNAPEESQEFDLTELRSEPFEAFPLPIILFPDEPESTQPFKEDAREETQLHKAAMINDMELLDRIEVTEDLIRTKNKEGETVFHCAAKVGAKKFIQHLIEKQIQAYEKYHNLFFHDIRNLELLPAIPIELIIDYTFNRIEELTTVLAMQDDSGCTPLMVALKNNHPQAAKLLIPRYKDLSIKNKFGQTVQDLAQHTRFEKIEALLNPGAIEELHNAYLSSANTTKTALTYTFLTPPQIKPLEFTKVELNLDSHKKIDSSLFLFVKGGLLETIKEHIAVYRSHIDCQDENGDTPLHHAMRYAQVEIANYLNNRLHADRTKENNKGELAINVHQHSTGATILHTMVRLGVLEMVSKLLSDYKANPNLTDNNEWSPLHFAAYHNYVDHAALLIKHKASLYTQEKEGLTPLHIAIANKHEKTALFLIKKIIDFSLKDMFGVIALHAAIDTEQETVAHQIVYNEKYSPYAEGTPYNKILSKLLEHILKTLLNPAYESNVSIGKDQLIKLVKEYTSAQPSILLKNDDDQTALHRAAQWSSRDKADQMCTFLIHHGAKPEEQDALGYTYTKYLQDERVKQ